MGVKHERNDLLQSRSDEEGATDFMFLFRLFNPEFSEHSRKVNPLNVQVNTFFGKLWIIKFHK